MADHTQIQWTEATWNPVSGCRKVSAGCDSCYAIKEAHRMAGNPNAKVAAAYEGLTQVQNGRLNWTGTFRELPDRLGKPLGWKTPRRVFVNSLSDLFGEGISDEFLDQCFAVMALCPQHTFQVLTKRPERMVEYLSYRGGSPPPAGSAADITPTLVQRAAVKLVAEGDARHVRGSQALRATIWRWPLRNVWLGVSVEDQKAADLRIPLLLRTPAAVRFLSCEPLLGSVCLEPWLWQPECIRLDNLLHWVIAGGESGPGSRPMAFEWPERLLRQCRAVGVPFFLKQLGSVWARAESYHHAKGGDIEEWPEALRVREFPEVSI